MTQAKKPAKNSLDEASAAMLYQGCNLSQLTVLFRRDHRTIVERIHGVQPCGTRSGHNIYAVHDVAPLLADIPPDIIEDRITRMHHNELPKMLTKEFWAGQRSKQLFQLEAGDLWPTSKIIDKVGEAFKTCKMSIMLLSDAVERETEFTDRQRETLRKLIDGALTDLHKSLVERLTVDDGDSDGESNDDEEL
ncbi:terminase small subunit [Pectobacterium phage MA12]|uniref:Terminase small subunit n=1 Tax=Pectobacterium phage MA12 TaxID=2686474 RepID=A0A6B9RQ21_9CAUD|nr:terminase small subunit [Pectobacterium phage MA11]YP_010000250.1 terminase small subunit [Pectobacterium phage MA12]QGF21036.1 terminase small subunit [Pectobacterium phage MA11]QHI00855.1 terminase small subunit [Pectobacterium phage MA12]